MVVVTILEKNLKEQDLSVNFSAGDLNVVPGESEQSFKLAHKVVPNFCSFKINSTKVEIKLEKSEGIRWEKLEGDAEAEGPKCIPQTSSTACNQSPSYPTSKGTSWTTIEKEITEQEKKEKSEGEEALNKLFQEIYGKGSDEVKRAVNKSYMESGGTVLSTNWGEIGTKNVDVEPPEGMEWKKWEAFFLTIFFPLIVSILFFE